ncbi:AraC-type DNA-binding protein [Nannocystis exedens]|uniref:AraC-type DNA-binding protein n=1 Tax=Nannocystis exedens TaxID=54 RepID=A0A1I2BW39_9BACT|nr:AraC family transcriptional regulator [Nannocystis exedens]PCC71225.1 HTH-type transcriptional regulator YesS [Nannocystis exedens]SFE60224.1 AraC-type DNA-binding protein [Nannocystis exedens]
MRIVSDEPYFGMKETFLIGRFEAGRSEFWTHGREWSGAPGSVVLFAPGDVHRDLKRDGPVTYQLIGFSTPRIDSLGVQSCLAADDPRGLPFQRLHDAVAAGADRFALECALTEAIGAMAAIEETRFEPTRPVRRALGLMRERWADALTLDELAEYAGLDKYHLCRAFRAQVGMPPHAYLTQLRILHAKALLAAGARPKDIAPQVGLYDQSQLNRHFRRIVGMTPGQYSAKNRQSPATAGR